MRPAKQDCHCCHLLIIISLSLAPLLAAALNFSFISGQGPWSSPDQLVTFGSSTVNNYGAILTDGDNSVGWVVYRKPIPFLDATFAPSSFTTSFTFQILSTTCQGCAGDGMAFMIISNSSHGPPDHSTGEFLGLVSGDNTNNVAESGHVFAIEFDTYQNTDLNDTSSSHIGIDIDSVVSLAHADTGPGTNLPDYGLYENSTFTVWIDYNISTSVTEVRMVNTKVSTARPEFPILSLQYNLSKIFSPSMFVGFSSSTGVSQQSSIVYSWSFSTDGFDATPAPAPPPSSSKQTPAPSPDAHSSSPSLNCAPSPSLPEPVVVSNPRSFAPTPAPEAGFSETDPTPSKRSRHRWVAPFVSSFMSCLFIAMLAAVFWVWWSMIVQRRRFEGMGKVPIRYTYRELKGATGGFSKRLYLGGGSSGSVYKGRLGGPGSLFPFIPFSSFAFIMVGVKKVGDAFPVLKKLVDSIPSPFSNGSRMVAVKKLIDAPQGRDVEFLSEISLISRVRHPNLVQLLGWCHEKEKRLLVYDYMANGSLDKHLFGIVGVKLKWDTRFRIVGDIAAALEYLHGGLERCVVHRDVKAGNVMLDEAFNGFLGDFGLACLMQNPTGSTANMSGVGTIGYVAPEVPDMGRYTEKADVYSFGVLTLEIVSGRRVLDYTVRKEEENLVRWVWLMHERKRLMEVVDSKLGGERYEETVRCMLHIGLLCCHPLPRARPTMKEVRRILRECRIVALPTSRPVLSYTHQLFTPTSPRSQNTRYYYSNAEEELPSHHGLAARWFCSPPHASPFSPLSDTLLSPPRDP